MRLSAISLCAAIALAAVPQSAHADDLCLQLVVNGRPTGPCVPVPADTTCVEQELVVANVVVGVYVCVPMGEAAPNTAR